MANDWKQYQEEAAEFFRSIGMRAETDVSVKGVRTSHDIDVLVTSEFAGFDTRWIVECKRWQTAITKLHVLALREIVSDLGADRGILLAENGFQSGAIEAARLTNVQPTSLANLRTSAEFQVYQLLLRELYDRVESCDRRYQSISKYDRIALALRPEVGFAGYSGRYVLSVAENLLAKATRGDYPLEADNSDWTSQSFRDLGQPLPRRFSTPRDVHTAIDVLVSELEQKLSTAEAALQAPGASPP